VREEMEAARGAPDEGGGEEERRGEEREASNARRTPDRI